MIQTPQTKTLKNGLRIIHVPFPNLHSVSLKLMGRAGSSWEGLNETGVAHFLEHLSFEGTQKYPSYDKLQGLLNDVGGQHNGYTSENMVAYLAKVLNEDLEKGLDYLSQILIHPLIKQKDVEKHREIITQEILMYEDKPVSKFFMDALKYIYPAGSRLQIPVIGTMDFVKKATSEDIANFRLKHYFAKNFILGIGSSLNSDEVFNKSEKFFEEMESGEQENYLPIELSKAKIVYTQKNDKVQQTTVSIGFEGYNVYNKRKYAKNILADILGGNDLSRLFTKIRQELGLAYYVGCETSSVPSYGSIAVLVQLDRKNLETVLGIIKDELKQISKNDVTDEEFNRSKKSVAASFAFDQENVENQVNLYTKIALEGREEESYDSILQNYLDVTKEDIKSTANELFSQNPKILVLSNQVANEDVENFKL